MNCNLKKNVKLKFSEKALLKKIYRAFYCYQKTPFGAIHKFGSTWDTSFKGLWIIVGR